MTETVASATAEVRSPYRYDAVFFDHDGTLVNSLPVVIAATNAALERHGYKQESAHDVVAGMVLATTPRMGHHARIQDIAQQTLLAADFYAEARRLGPQLATAYAGVEDLITAIAQRGLHQGVISNNQGEVVRIILKHLGMASSFALMYGEDDFLTPKPHPSGLIKAATVLQVPITRCLFVGDSENDSEAAAAAHMPSVGVTWGIHPRSAIEKLGFTHIIDHPRELLTLLE